MPPRRRKALLGHRTMCRQPHDGGRNDCHNPQKADPEEKHMAWTRRVRLLIQRLLLAAFAAALGATPFDAAYAEYPDRQVTIIVCFPAGGGADIAARLISTPLGEALGGTVIIENRGGAGGNIGITAAMRSAPDGYTLLVCSSA